MQLAVRLTRHVAILDDVVEDGRVAVVLRRPRDLQRAAADARQVDRGRRGRYICWNDIHRVIHPVRHWVGLT